MDLAQLMAVLGCCVAISSIGVAAAPAAAGTPLLGSTGGGPHLVRLQRVELPASEGSDDAHAHKSFYVGYVSVGLQPQRLRVTFDTASGQVFLPSAICHSPACIERRRYVPQRSLTAVDINADGAPVQTQPLLGRPAHRDAVSIGISSVDLGDGKVTGDLFREVLCLGGNASAAEGRGERACAEVGIVAATQMTDTPFRAMPQDGTVGLGLSGLAISQAFSIVAQLSSTWKGMPMAFGLYLGRNTGEVAFGGYNPQRLASPLTWLPVVKPTEGYWQVRILRIRVGNHTIAACDGAGGCRGIVDSSAARLGVPAPLLQDFESALPPVRSGSGCAGPELRLDLEGGTELTLGAQDYTTGQSCEALLAPLHLPEEFAGAFLLGEPILRRYYTAFDAQTKRMAFGLAKVTPEEPAEPSPVQGLELPAGAPALGRPIGEEGRSLTTSLLQAFAMQVVLVLLLSLTGFYVKSMNLFVARASTVLVRRGWLSRTDLVAVIPQNESPEGDECVICLGCCEEECQAASGGKGKPRWCRLRCGHHFHEDCIFEWLWKAQCCPVCRSPLLKQSSTSSTTSLDPALPSRAEESQLGGRSFLAPRALLGPNGLF